MSPKLKLSKDFESVYGGLVLSTLAPGKAIHSERPGYRIRPEITLTRDDSPTTLKQQISIAKRGSET